MSFYKVHWFGMATNTFYRVKSSAKKCLSWQLNSVQGSFCKKDSHFFKSSQPMLKDTTVLIKLWKKNMHLDCLSWVLKWLTLSNDTNMFKGTFFFWSLNSYPYLWGVFAFFETLIFATIASQVWKSSNLTCRGIGPKDTNWWSIWGKQLFQRCLLSKFYLKYWY